MDPTASPNNYFTYNLHIEGIGNIPTSGFSFVEVTARQFMCSVNRRNFKNMVASLTLNPISKCQYLGWLFDNVADEDFSLIYTDYRGTYTSPDTEWSAFLRGILFRHEADAVMFKLVNNDLLHD